MYLLDLPMALCFFSSYPKRLLWCPVAKPIDSTLAEVLETSSACNFIPYFINCSSVSQHFLSEEHCAGHDGSIHIVTGAMRGQWKEIRGEIQWGIPPQTWFRLCYGVLSPSGSSLCPVNCSGVRHYELLIKLGILAKCWHTSQNELLGSKRDGKSLTFICKWKQWDML